MKLFIILCIRTLVGGVVFAMALVGGCRLLGIDPDPGWPLIGFAITAVYGHKLGIWCSEQTARFLARRWFAP